MKGNNIKNKKRQRKRSGVKNTFAAGGVLALLGKFVAHDLRSQNSLIKNVLNNFRLLKKKKNENSYRIINEQNNTEISEMKEIKENNYEDSNFN